MRRFLSLLFFVLIVCLGQTTEARKLALLVGVDEYVDIKPLKCCVNDMKTLKEALMRIDFEEDDIQMLVTGGAYIDFPTKRMIEKRLFKILSDAQPSDTVFVAFSGYGAQSGENVYFCPPDADLEYLDETCISITKVMDDLAKCQAKFKWIVIDACRNELKQEGNGLRTVPAPPAGVALFQSCSDGELSYEKRGAANDYFMKNFAEALSGKADENHDGQLTLMEVCNWTSSQTKSEVQKMEKKTQRPCLSGLIADFSLAEDLSDSLANALAEEAKKAMDEKNYALAIEKYTAALAIDPTDESWKHNLELAKKMNDNSHNPFTPARDGNSKDILIKAPLAWSMNSIQIEWTDGQNENSSSRFIYGSDPANNKKSLRIISDDPIVKTNGNDENAGGRPSPFSAFKIAGSKVNSAVYMEGLFNYNLNRDDNEAQWSNVEKSAINQVLKSAFDQNASNQRMIFTIDFINNTESRLFFKSNSANSVPVYCNNVQIGDARLIGAEKFIAASGKPVSFQFEMSLNKDGKQQLANSRPIIFIEDSQLNIQSLSTAEERVDDAIQESISVSRYFTIAILAGNEVKEWKIRWSKDNPVTLRDALEAINDSVCEKNNNNIPVFNINDDHIVSVCNALYTDNDNTEWVAGLKKFKGEEAESVRNQDLSETPGRGERYVFHLVNLDVKRLESRGKAGFAEAVFQLAKRYDVGDCVPEDKVKALELLQKAAEMRNPEAQYCMAECYFYGTGFPENKAEAINWYRKAAEQGNVKAQCDLGWCYNNGEGVTEDKTEAAEWYRKAAEQGYAKAQFNLGLLYDNGKGVPEDKQEAVNWYRKAAEQGNAQAQLLLGLCCKNGNGVSKDDVEAAKWFAKAAEQGLSTAQLLLGVCYEYGYGVSVDKTEAVKLYRKAAEQGHASAQRALGICYENGIGITIDNVEAAKWYRKAADQGNADSQLYLGSCYEFGKGVSVDKSEAAKWYRKAAEQGLALAQCILGVCYEVGIGVLIDKAEAVKWYRKAADQGHARAQYNLGECYYYGRGVSEDKVEAVNWYRKAAEQDYLSAQHDLGWCYENGDGVRRNYTEAAKWYRKAAEQGDASSQYSLAFLYQNGRGVQRNYSEAVNWYRKAAEQDYAMAQNNLGWCYENGWGVQRNYSEAFKWYRKSAEKGNPEAQCNLGVCYYYGRGVSQSYYEAVQWYRKAADQGFANAQYNLGTCYEQGRGVSFNYNTAVQWYRKAAAQGHSQAINKINTPVYYD